MAIQDVHEAARQQGIRRLSDIELCVLETNGRFSFFARGPEDDRDGAPADHGVTWEAARCPPPSAPRSRDRDRRGANR